MYLVRPGQDHHRGRDQHRVRDGLQLQRHLHHPEAHPGEVRTLRGRAEPTEEDLSNGGGPRSLVQ